MEIIRKKGTGLHGNHPKGSRHPKSKKWEVSRLINIKEGRYEFVGVFSSLGEIARTFGISYMTAYHMKVLWQEKGERGKGSLRINEIELGSGSGFELGSGSRQGALKDPLSLTSYSGGKP